MSLFCGNEEAIISALIAAIYDAALNPEKWQVFVDLLQAKLDGIEPVFYVADSKTAMMEQLLLSKNWAEVSEPYMAHYNAINPWLPSLVSRPQVAYPFTGDELISRTALERTEFYCDFFRHLGNMAGVVAVINYRDSHAFSCLGLHCSGKSLDRNGTDLRQLVARLSPHITRAIEISRHLQHGHAWKASLERMLEELTSPALLIDSDWHVSYANNAAQAILRSRTLTLDAQGRIATGKKTEETKALRKALAAAFSPIKAAPGVIRITRAGRGTNKALPLIARMMPLAGGIDGKLDVPSPVPPVEMEPEVLMLLTDPGAKLVVRAQELHQLFGLTSAEVCLAQALAQGTSLKGYAAAEGITEGTARVQLNSVFAKTSAHRQAELVALLAQLSNAFQLGN